MLQKTTTISKITLILLAIIVKLIIFAAPSYAGVRGSTVEIYTPNNDLQTIKPNSISIEDGALYIISNNGEKILIKGS